MTRFRVVRLTALCVTLALVCASGRAQADVPHVAFARAGGGQPGLALGFDATSTLRAAVCAAATCPIESGKEIAFPAELRAAIPSARLSVVGIGRERRAVLVRISDAHSGREWQAVVVAPLGGTSARVIFSGFTGFLAGEDGLRHGPWVELSEPDEAGVRSILVGEVREDLALCGRPTILEPALLASSDLELHPAKVQRLSVEERERARRVVAERVSADAAAPAGGLLRAVAASSAVGNPAALTDGDPNSTWAENRGGAGRGEFVLMNVPARLPLLAFELQVRPAAVTPELGVAPREFWLATSRDVVHVSMPEDAWKHPGARYQIRLDPPLEDDCLALVTDSAFDEAPGARVTFAELKARTEFDGASVESLVQMLAGGGQRAEAVKSVLSALGTPAFAAVAAAFATLDEGGRRVALEILDQAPCSASAPAYLAALAGSVPAQQDHARERLRRCGKDAAPLIAEAVTKARGPLQRQLIDELVLLSPELAVDVIVPLLATEFGARRAELRIALARAALAPSARPRISLALNNAELSPGVSLEVLRALGEKLTSFQPEAGQALARLSAGNPNFRTRYLLLEPAAALSAKDAAARAALSRALASDPDPRLRARAAAVVNNPRDLLQELVARLSDPEVRVREAALRALARAELEAAVAPAAHLLREDPWPLVRRAAADTLATTPPAPATDQVLGQALEDPSAAVRARVVSALGVRRALPFASALRAHLVDREESSDVQRAAAEALGAMCDRAAADTLTAYAVKLANPLASAEESALASAALTALVRVSPSDLGTRLAPLLSPKAPPETQKVARALIAHPGRGCAKAPDPLPTKLRVPAS